MKWIHFLASSCLRCQRTLCYQHRWSRHGSGEQPGANYKQATVHTNESLRIRPLLLSDSCGSSRKMSESQWSCATKCTVKTLDGQFGSHANHRGLAATPLGEASSRRRSPMSCLLFLLHFLVRGTWANTNRLLWANRLCSGEKDSKTADEKNGFPSYVTMKHWVAKTTNINKQCMEND